MIPSPGEPLRGLITRSGKRQPEHRHEDVIQEVAHYQGLAGNRA